MSKVDPTVAWLGNKAVASKFFDAYQSHVSTFEAAQAAKYPGTKFELNAEQLAQCLRLAMADLPAKQQVDLDIPGVMNTLTQAVGTVARAQPVPRSSRMKRIRTAIIDAAKAVWAFVKAAPQRITAAAKRVINAIKMRFNALVAAMAARRAKRKARREAEAAAAAGAVATA